MDVTGKLGLTESGRRQRGASGVEYALIAAMVAIVLVVFVPTISGAVSTLFTEIQGALTTAAGP
jgi:pilus assembly protein Flp/PilA